jgi:hypothetical protein
MKEMSYVMKMGMTIGALVKMWAGCPTTGNSIQVGEAGKRDMFFSKV